MLFPRQPRSFFLGFAALAFVTLASVFVLEYAFGFKPCEMCLWQRYPWAVILGLTVPGLAIPQKPWYWVGVIGLALLVSSGLGWYHVAIEQGWVVGATGCSQAASTVGLTLEEIRERILNAPIVACNQPMWVWHGITLALINAVWSSLLTLYVAIYLIRSRL